MNETEQNPSQEMDKSDDGSGPSKELESIRSRFADALYFLMPGVYHHLLTLSHGPWPHSAALEVSILQWLENILLSGERCEPRHQHLLEDDGRMLHVLARHLMDDYWWVSVLGLHVILTHDEISGTGPGVAMAIARIKGSGRRLPYTAHDSARFNLQLTSRIRMVHVHADYILDDHWKNSVFNIVFHETDEEIPEFPLGDARRNPGMAVARIVGSADRLPWTVAGPHASRRAAHRQPNRDSRPPV